MGERYATELAANIIISADLVAVSVEFSGVEFEREVSLVHLVKEAASSMCWSDRLDLRKALAEALEVIDGTMVEE